MLISAHFQAVSSRREGRRTKMHVGRRLSCCNEESTEVLGLQSGVGSDQLRQQLAQKAQRVLWCQAVKAVIQRGAQFEGDMMWNMQPVQFIVEDVRQIPTELPYSSNDSGGGVKDALQRVSRSSC